MWNNKDENAHRYAERRGKRLTFGERESLGDRETSYLNKDSVKK